LSGTGPREAANDWRFSHFMTWQPHITVATIVEDNGRS
jgi:hypothetical protein